MSVITKPGGRWLGSNPNTPAEALTLDLWYNHWATGDESMLVLVYIYIKLAIFEITLITLLRNNVKIRDAASVRKGKLCSVFESCTVSEKLYFWEIASNTRGFTWTHSVDIRFQFCLKCICITHCIIEVSEFMLHDKVFR